MCPHGKAQWRHLANTNGKSIGSAVCAQLMAKSPYTLQWATLSPKIVPSRGGSGPHLIHDSLSRTEPTVQTASRSVQLFSHRWPQSVPILYNGRPFPPKLPLPTGDLDHHLTHDSFSPAERTNQMASLLVQPFLHRRVSLHFIMGRPFPSQNCPFPWGSGPPSNTWFSGTTRVINPNSISIGSAILAELTNVTDRQTD